MDALNTATASRTLEKSIWRDTTIIRDNIPESVRELKAHSPVMERALCASGENQPRRNILTDGSSQVVQTLLEHDLVDELHLLMYSIILGAGKRLFPGAVHKRFALRSATPYPTGVVGLNYVRGSS